MSGGREGRVRQGAAGRVDADEANHRIANNLTMLASLVRARTAALAGAPAEPSRDDVRALLGDLSARIQAVAALHRLLSRAPEGATEEVDLASYVQEVCAALTRFHGGLAGISLSCACEPCRAGTREALRIALIIGELVTNAVRHAYPAGARGTVKVYCRPRRGGDVVVDVTDEGRGLPPGFEPTRDGGMGFRTIYALAGEIGATVSFFSSGRGLCSRIVLPLRARCADDNHDGAAA